MTILENPYRGKGLPERLGADIVSDPGPACALFARCPAADETPLLDAPELAETLGLAGLSLKDERGRMGLGSFKALGAAFAIAKAASAAAAAQDGEVRGGALDTALAGETFVCASAGNHGLSVAAGARIFGASSVVYLPETAPESFVAKLTSHGAEVRRHGTAYEASMAAAMVAAEREGWRLLSDSTWPGYAAPALDVMEGYLILGAEIGRQIPAPPTHIFLQAGVGGLAAAMAAAARFYWGEGPCIVVVEPDRAPALLGSIRAGRPVASKGPISNMGRLDCKEPSHLALQALAGEADIFVTISDEDAANAVAMLKAHGIATSPSGAAGVAGLLRHGAELGVNRARVLAIISEGPEDGG